MVSHSANIKVKLFIKYVRFQPRVKVHLADVSGAQPEVVMIKITENSYLTIAITITITITIITWF
jgi:hypothetical protein